MRLTSATACLAILVLLATGAGARAGQSAAPRPAALEPAASGGLEAVDRALAQLSVHARLMLVGAHPDDEDNSLLVYVSRGLGGEAAYFSLSRGEGGQNLIGPELGEPLGLIRTGELMAARRIEGTRQWFARAYDFGYTRSLEETFERWPREVLLEDTIRAVRRFKPQVVVSIFPPDARAGHGQHQASAVIALEAYERAGDATLLPELGLPAWSPRALYRRAWSRDDATLGFSLGSLDPISGRSIGQVAAASRSRHRSQDMGRIEPIGEYRGGLHWVAGGAGEGGGDPFAGIDTRLAGIAAPLPEGERRRFVEERLEWVEAFARNARGGLSPVELERAVEAFARILDELRAARAATDDWPEAAAVRDILAEKIEVAEAGLAAAAGVVVDALADRETVPLGESFEVTASLWASGSTRVELRAVSLHSAEGWVASAGEAVESPVARGLLSSRFRVQVPAGGRATEPYFLARPRRGDLYDWTGVPERLRGEPIRPGLSARFELAIADGATVVLEREVVYRFADQAVGEIRRPVRAVPPVEVAIGPSLAFRRLGHAPGDLAFEVTLASNLDRDVTGELEVRFAEAGVTFEAGPMELAPGDRELVRLSVQPSADLEPGLYRIEADFTLADGRILAAHHPVFDPSHVRPSTRAVPSTARVRVLPIELPELDRVGYVRGASDRVPEQLEKIGLPVEVLELERIDEIDLAAFDAIVIGSRAYEVDPVLRERNGLFLDYVRGGGTLIVQYQQYQFVRGGYAPLAIDIARPHGRITDETAPVRVLVPEHPVFHRPNSIGERDWDGWVQERGLYFGSEWHEAFTPLLAMQDPGGQPEQRGGLLVAECGEGIYVYTGISFFRVLPAGVPGAYRLFANLLALGAR